MHNWVQPHQSWAAWVPPQNATTKLQTKIRKQWKQFCHTLNITYYNVLLQKKFSENFAPSWPPHQAPQHWTHGQLKCLSQVYEIDLHYQWLPCDYGSYARHFLLCLSFQWLCQIASSSRSQLHLNLLVHFVCVAEAPQSGSVNKV